MNASPRAIFTFLATKSWLVGMGAVVLTLGGLAAYTALNGPQTLADRMAQLPSETVVIDWLTAPVSVPQDPPPDFAADTPRTPDEAPPTTEIDDANSPVVIPDEPDDNGNIASVPFPGLYEDTPNGPLPIANTAENITPFTAYRRPFDTALADGKPVISLGIFDLGLSDSATEAAMRTMPPEVSLIFSPYMNSSTFWVNEARHRGHEIWLSLPVEVKDYPLTDPGPHTVLVGAAERENIEKLRQVMASAAGYVGFVSPPQPTFIKSAHDMRPIIGAIYNRGLGYIDGDQNPSMIPQTMAHGQNASYSTVDVWIDAPATKEAILQSLAQAEQTARQQGYAAAILHPYPLSYQLVQEWLKTLPGKGFVLAPLSAQTGQ